MCKPAGSRPLKLAQPCDASHCLFAPPLGPQSTRQCHGSGGVLKRNQAFVGWVGAGAGQGRPSLCPPRARENCVLRCVKGLSTVLFLWLCWLWLRKENAYAGAQNVQCAGSGWLRSDVTKQHASHRPPYGSSLRFCGFVNRTSPVRFLGAVCVWFRPRDCASHKKRTQNRTQEALARNLARYIKTSCIWQISTRTRVPPLSCRS